MQFRNGKTLTRAGWIAVIALITSVGLVIAALRLTVRFGATVISAPITWQFIGVDNKDNIPIPDGGETTFWISFTNQSGKFQGVALYSTVFDVSGGKVWSGLYDNATGQELPDSDYGPFYKRLDLNAGQTRVVKVILADVNASPGEYWIWGLNTGFSLYLDNIV